MSAEPCQDPWPEWPPGFADSREDVGALLVLSTLRGLTPRRLLELGVERGTASATLAFIRRGKAGGPLDRALATTVDAGALAEAVQACGARFVVWGSPEYPEQLRAIHDPPAWLFLVGHPVPDPTRAVAVVGARGCTDLGREVAREIGRALGLAGITVVSGAARGIDAAAHEGALSTGVGTLAVLGCGIDVDYPAASRGMLEGIRRTGTVLSEYPPGVRPEQRNFPARNRLVAGLCSVTVVVEGAEGSGSMITAEHALEFGRDVYAVPGAVTNPLATVPLRLIREGARMIRGGQDLLEDLGVETVPDDVAERIDLSPAERSALDRLNGPTLPDRVADELRIAIPEAVGLLMRLELRGLVRGVGGRFESTLEARRRARSTRSPAEISGPPRPRPMG